MSQHPLTVAVIGAGGRGSGFGHILATLPQLARVVAVAEPRDAYRESFAKTHKLPPERVFRTWQEFVAQPKLADAVIIATMDRDHVGPAVACSQLGYHMMLEKPMAVSLADCQAIAAAQRAAGTITSVCHSLRYQKGFRLLKDLLTQGRVGRIISIDQLEQVAWWHQAHSFVRGNWGNEGRSTFMLLAKSCHDVDYIAWIAGQPCLRVSSFGKLSYFRPDQAPAGATDRCVSCPLEPECAYSAFRHYVDTNREQWPAAACSHDHSREAHLEAIRTGPYGRCVWRTDNDVVDHQVVNFEFAQDITATFTMTAFTQRGGRRVRVHGTEGQIDFDEAGLKLSTFASGNVEQFTLGAETGGHGGGDKRVLLNWLRAIRAGDSSLVVSDVQESLRTHTIVFAAERARHEGRVVTLAEMG